MCDFACMGVYLFMYVCMFVCVCLRVYVCLCVRVGACLFVCMCDCSLFVSFAPYQLRQSQCGREQTKNTAPFSYDYSNEKCDFTHDFKAHQTASK